MPTADEFARYALGPESPRNAFGGDRYSHQNLEKWRQICGPLADACTALIKCGRPSDMLAELGCRAKSEGGPFQAFLDHCNTVPAGSISAIWKRPPHLPALRVSAGPGWRPGPVRLPQSGLIRASYQLQGEENPFAADNFGHKTTCFTP